jgi:hypothetical protein
LIEVEIETDRDRVRDRARDRDRDRCARLVPYRCHSQSVAVESRAAEELADTLDGLQWLCKRLGKYGEAQR